MGYDLNRRISPEDPKAFEATIFESRQIYTEIHEFFEDNFKGAITVDFEESATGFLVTSAVAIAYFFKYLLNAVFGRTAIRVKMRAVEKHFGIEVRWRKACELTDRDELLLRHIARTANFTLELDRKSEICSAVLDAELMPSRTVTIYANTSRHIINAFNGVFFNG